MRPGYGEYQQAPSPQQFPQCQGTSDTHLLAGGHQQASAYAQCSKLHVEKVGAPTPRTASLHLSSEDGVGASPVWCMTAPGSQKPSTSGEASCAPANDKRSLKVGEMNEFEEPPSQLPPSQLCCHGLSCLHLHTRRQLPHKDPAPDGELASSHSRCHSGLSLHSLDPITGQMSVEAGTTIRQFATVWQRPPQGY